MVGRPDPGDCMNLDFRAKVANMNRLKDKIEVLNKFDEFTFSRSVCNEEQ